MNTYYSSDENSESQNNSTPLINYPPTEEIQPQKIKSEPTNESSQETICELDRPKVCPQIINTTSTAWPVFVMAIIGLGLAIYTAIGPNIKANRIVFGFIFLVLWTIMWCLILWVLWKSGQYKQTWLLLIVPITLAMIFFIVVVILAI